MIYNEENEPQIHIYVSLVSLTCVFELHSLKLAVLPPVHSLDQDPAYLVSQLDDGKKRSASPPPFTVSVSPKQKRQIPKA